MALNMTPKKTGVWLNLIQNGIRDDLPNATELAGDEGTDIEWKPAGVQWWKREVNGRNIKRKTHGFEGGAGGLGTSPPGPKVTVFTSPYSPPVSSFLPLNRKVTPAAFPALTMTSFRPRTVRSLPASRSSDGVDLPSAEIEIQDSSRTWMRTVNSPGSAGVELGDVLEATVGAGGGLLVDEFVFGELVVGAVPAAEL